MADDREASLGQVVATSGPLLGQTSTALSEKGATRPARAYMNR